MMRLFNFLFMRRVAALLLVKLKMRKWILCVGYAVGYRWFSDIIRCNNWVRQGPWQLAGDGGRTSKSWRMLLLAF